MQGAGETVLIAGCQMPGGAERGVLCHVTKLFRVCDDTELNPNRVSGYIESASVAHGEVLSHRASVGIAVPALPKGRAIFMIARPFAFQQILTDDPALTLPHTPARAGNTRAAARVFWGGKLPFRAIHTGGIIGTNAEVHQIESSGSVVLSVSGSIDSFSEPETTFFLAIDTVHGHTQAPDGVKGAEGGIGATRSHAQPLGASMASMVRTYPLRPAGARV